MLKSHLCFGDHVISIVISIPMLLPWALVYRQQPSLSFLVMVIFLWSVCSLWLWQVVCLLGPPVQHSLLVDFPALCSLFILVCTLLWAILSPLPTSSVATMVFQLHWLWAISILQTFKTHPGSVLALSPRGLVREGPSQGECCHIFKLFLIQFSGLYPIFVQHSQNLGRYTLSQLLLVHAGSVLQFLWVIVPFFLYQPWHVPSWNMLWFNPIFFWRQKGGQIGVSCVSSQDKGLCIVFKWGGSTSL